jgi:hypothetical protein
MRTTAKRLCPFCAGEIALDASVCEHCGKNLKRMMAAHSQPQPKPSLYHIVPDGTKYGIALAGSVKIHGLELEKAERLAAILNSVADIEEAG